MIPMFRPSFVSDPESQQDALQAVQEVLASGQLAEGPLSERFEQEVSRYLGAPARLVNSGTSAIRLTLHLAGARPGTEVITTPATCLASNMAILETGAEIVWADVDPTSGNIDPWSVEKLITPKTVAILAVDWAGQLCDFTNLRAIANGIAVVEDAAHAFGPIVARGARGTHICYSLQAIKHVTSGDGGALVCPGPAAHERARLLRWFGLDRTGGDSMRCRQQVPEAGFKMQPNEIMSAIGLASLKGARARLRRHHEIAWDYTVALRNLHPYVRVSDYAGGSRSEEQFWWMYPIRVSNPPLFERFMAQRGVQVGQVHARNDNQRAFDSNGHVRVPLKGVEAFYQHQTNLPVGAHLSEQDVKHVLRCVFDWAQTPEARWS